MQGSISGAVCHNASEPDNTIDSASAEPFRDSCIENSISADKGFKRLTGSVRKTKKVNVTLGTKMREIQYDSPHQHILEASILESEILNQRIQENFQLSDNAQPKSPHSMICEDGSMRGTSTSPTSCKGRIPLGSELGDSSRGAASSAFKTIPGNSEFAPRLKLARNIRAGHKLGRPKTVSRIGTRDIIRRQTSFAVESGSENRISELPMPEFCEGSQNCIDGGVHNQIVSCRTSR